jgi:hypothetical protein
VTEHDLQKAVVDFLAIALGDRIPWTAVDHAARLSPRQGAARKRRAVKRGQADLRFVLPPHGQSGEIELKIKGAYQKPEQKAWEAAVTAAGARYALCRSVAEVADALTEWGVTLRARAAA